MAATWKKVIVSGSSAELANVNIDNALRVSGSIAVSTAAGVIINEIGNTATTTFLTGSFTGSFTGAHTGSLFGTASQAVSASYIIGGAAAQVFPYTGSAQFTGSLGVTGSLTVSGSMTIVGRSTITDLTGSLFGTASNAVSSSYALTASYLAGYVSAFPYTGSAQITGSLGITGSLNVSGSLNALLPNASTAFIVTYNNTSGVLGYTNAGALSIVSASYAATASYAVQTIAALSQGAGIAAFSYNGSSSVNVAVSGAAALSANSLPKWTGAGFSNSNITDTGTAITVASNVPVTINSNLSVTGDLTVSGTASFQNTQNVLIADQFILLASGSNSLTDGGFIVATSTGPGYASGSAFYLESATTGNFGRFAVASNVSATASQVTADEFMVTSKISGSNPSNATPPTWGSTTNGLGNMWVNSATSDIYIWA